MDESPKNFSAFKYKQIGLLYKNLSAIKKWKDESHLSPSASGILNTHNTSSIGGNSYANIPPPGKDYVAYYY